MTTTMERKDEIMSKLLAVGDFTCRPMMGEFLIYLDGVLVGGIYDGDFLLKITPGNKKYALPERIPYDGAKRTMYIIDKLDDAEFLRAVTMTARDELKLK